MQKQGDALVLEQVKLLSDKTTFLKTASELVGLESKAVESVACKDQFSLSVPDMDEKTVVERSAGSHALSNCRILSSTGTQSSTLLEIRGEFIDGRLSRAIFRFKAGERSRIMPLLQKRFGPGDEIVLSEQVLLDQKDTPYHYWQDNNEIWLLSATESGTVLLIQQDLKGGMTLPTPKKASHRGEPVSLDDIGIGKLDLSAPLPKLDLPDAGVMPTD